jgi:hypothetical protein
MRIAFGINAGVGKDISVDYLIKKYGGVKHSFAKPLYDILYYAQKKLLLPLEKNRKFLQIVGDCFREQDDDIFVNLCLMESNLDKNKNHFISDLRYKNEFDMLKKNGWICIKIIRNVDESRIGNGDCEHKSEHSLDSVPDNNWHYIIDNNDSLESLYSKLDNIAKYYL